MYIQIKKGDVIKEKEEKYVSKKRNKMEFVELTLVEPECTAH